MISKDGYVELYGSVPFIDFHYGNSTADYTSRIYEQASGRLSIPGKLSVGGYANDDYGLATNSLVSSGSIVTNFELRSTYSNGLRIVYGNYGFFIRNDGPMTYFLLTNSADQYGSWSSLRPLIINNATGAVSIGNGLTVSGTLTASTISIGGIGTLKSTIADSGSYIWLQGNSGVALYLGYDGRCVVPPTGAAGVRGATNNSLSCGHSSYLWTTVYAKTTAISSSDRNTKKDFRTFDSNENYEKFFMDLKPTIFKYIDGTSNRDHFGYISQDVEESLYKYGFDDLSFAGFCRDIKVDDNDEPVLDENGDVQWLYALRYEEFISLNTYMIQKLYEEKDALQEENTDLKSRVEKLEELVAQLIA